jgi:SAM-dependent methyltransferase
VIRRGVTFSLVCPTCGEELAREPFGLLCPGGHRFSTLKNGFDFVGTRHGVHYPVSGIDRMFRIQREHFWFVARRRLIVDWVLACGLGRGSTFLDLGAGSGDICSTLREHGLDAVAADYHLESEAAVHRFSESIPFHAVDAYRLPFRGLDAVGLFDVLEHLDRPTEALAQVKGALHPGGWLFLTVPARRELWSNVDFYSGHRLRYDLMTLRKQVRAAGLKPVRASYFMSLLVPPLWVSRSMFRGRMPDRLGPEQVHERFEKLDEIPPASLNALALSALALERLWLKVADVPLGASIIAIARRPRT